jgi:hypothetical protein
MIFLMKTLDGSIHEKNVQNYLISVKIQKILLKQKNRLSEQ